MKQELNPKLFAGSITLVVLVAAVIGFVAISNRSSIDVAPNRTGTPPVAAAQTVGAGATSSANLNSIPGPYSGQPPASAQVVGLGSGSPH